MQFFHQPGAMVFDGAHADVERFGNARAGFAIDDHLGNLSFFRRQQGQPGLPRFARQMFGIHLPAARQGALHLLDQKAAIDGLFKKIEGTFLDRLDGRMHLGIAGHQDDRQKTAVFEELSLNFQPADFRHAQIANQTFMGPGPVSLEKIARRGEGPDFRTDTLQEFLKHPENDVVVVDDVNDRTSRLHLLRPLLNSPEADHARTQPRYPGSSLPAGNEYSIGPNMTADDTRMAMKILLTTTSFQDTPGSHHALLAGSGFEIVRARGPLNEAQMLDLIAAHGPFDGFLNGDDRITDRVIDAAGRDLKVIAKYGIGLDSIDVAHASALKIPVLYTPGVNHTTVAEHAFGLMIALAKDFFGHATAVKEGRWLRRTGHELAGKTLGILGLGRIGQEVVKRARAFDMRCVAFSPHWPEAFARHYDIVRADSAEAVLPVADVVSLHMGLSDATRGFINARSLATLKPGATLINTARGGLIVEEDVAAACRSGQLGGYATDVLDEEPIRADHPFLSIDNILITPHIGSRTAESVERQALRAVTNLVEYLNGGSDYIQANRF